MARCFVRYVFRRKRSCLITVIKMSFLDKAKKKAAEAAKKAGEKGAEGAKTAGGKVKDAGEKGVEKTKEAAEKAKGKIE